MNPPSSQAPPAREPRVHTRVREGMGRRHASYKMVAMVLGTNIVRKELGLPQAECLAADQRYSLTVGKA